MATRSASGRDELAALGLDAVQQLLEGVRELVHALTLDQGVDEAERVFQQVAEVGVDYDDVVATLEREGVDKFSDSFKELLDGVRSKRGELVSA